ncbi:MAG TPA: hypothetical protein VGY54_22300 [Polyangiaceae bacterium]|jgi:hypothetical protein|nr:hypothetical protein [Polyangiaceae bacterium]
MRRPNFPSTASVFVLAVASAFAGGLVAAHLWPRHANAEPIASTSTIYVPADGLVFRALDGRPIARLARDAHGGFLELYDDRRASAVRFPSGAAAAPERAAPSNAFVIDDEDPWKASAQPAAGADSSGFYTRF